MVGGAEEEVPLVFVQANILAGSRLDGRPSREMVIGEGVRPTAVARCDTDGVCSSSDTGSTFISSPFEVMGVTTGDMQTIPFLVGEVLGGKNEVGLPFAEIENPAGVGLD